MFNRLLTSVAAVCAALACAASAQAQALLVPTDRTIEPLALTYHRVEADIQDGAAQTRVDQAFHNHTDRALEATYVFPVPPGATVDDFALYIDGKRVPGKVLEANQARGIYEDIVRRMKDPGLVEWIGRDLFQARVFPVPARGEQRVEIRFSQVLPMDGGLYRYTYPLKSGRSPGRATEQDFTITAKISSQAPIRSIYSPTHDVYVRHGAKNKATVGFERERAVLDRDFVLYYTVGQEELGMRILSHRTGSEPGYFLLMLSPPSTYEVSKTPRRTITFVLDTSGSMSGEKMDRLKQATIHGLSTLSADDHFSLIRFSSDVEQYRPGFLRATEDNVAEAKRFVQQMEAAGGTAIHEALTVALAQRAPSVHYVVFVTDGRPTVGETDVEAIVNATRGAQETDTRVFAFGVGDDLNAVLIDRIAVETRGKSQYLRADAEVETALRSFFDKLTYPALSDVKLRIDHADAYAILPGELPDLFYGEQLIVVGRYRTATDVLVRVGGRLNEQTVGYDFEAALPAVEDKHDFVASIWAERQVGFLLDQVRLRGENPELRGEIVQLATRFGIVTPYTSYLVVEPSMQAATERPMAVPRGSQPAPRPRREQGLGTGSGGFFGDRGAGAAGGAPAPEAAAVDSTSTRDAEEYEFFDKDDDLRASEGKAAVGAAKKVAKMKGTAQASTPGRTSATYLGGVSFEKKGNAWVDTRYKAAMRTIRVRYLSEAYFALLDAIPGLREMLSLGESVTVVRNGIALVVADDGADAISPAELDALR